MFLEKQIASELPRGEKKRRIRKKNGRKRRRADSFSARLRYYTGAIGPFGCLVIGLISLWLGSLVLALVSPDRWRWLLLIGSGLLAVGNIWIGFIAYQDSHVFGMLCFGTILFTYVYILMNPQETWRPAALSGLGLVFTVSSFLGPHLVG
jgi:hypothetical protein